VTFTLSADETRTLHDLLSDHLRELRREVAHTDAKAFRHALVLRLELVERLVSQIEAESPAAAR
jgi:hypothetical protein